VEGSIRISHIYRYITRRRRSIVMRIYASENNKYERDVRRSVDRY
jgi:hypothetical protein